jgi:hypothetical protein
MKDSPSQRFLTASFDGPLRKDPKEGGGQFVHVQQWI